MRLVRLHRDAVLSMLRIAGLLSLEPPFALERAAAPQQPSKPPGALSEGRKRKGRPSVQFAGELLAITFPQSQWQDMEPTDAHRRCGQDVKVKARLKETGKPLPSPDSFARYMGRRE
jgi:hypothetical protein